MRPDLPTGTVTLLFTDIEGSTRLLDEMGAEAYGALLAEHHRVCREAWAGHAGVEIDTAGDAFFVVFARPSDALAAAAAAQEALLRVGLAVRMGVHTGEVTVNETGYVGIEVHRAARIAASGHGGQVLVSAATAALVEAPLTDLGEHRFKDLRAPERVFQLGGGEFLPLRSLYRSNLPVPATPFLGREPELAAVTAMLTEPGARLVSLTGPGGIGKTRLALQAAAEASDEFPDGVFWTSLAPLRDPSLVLTEVAAAVAVRQGEGGSALDDLSSGLTGKNLLLFCDNLEHLLPSAANEVARLVAACPPITVVVTSRERLRVPGEQVFAVPPMSESDGEALFRRRAEDAGSSLDSSLQVRELCARLDNLPLALELAAARMELFSPAQLLDRLPQRLDLLKGGRATDARQETLRATIAWSDDLLYEKEQQLFRRLSVFAGGCSYDSAEQVAGADPDTLESLLDKSLLRRRDTPTEPRFWMLETIREYAIERLIAAAEGDDLQRRHLDHYAALAADCYDETWGGHDDLARLEAERDNLRVALDTALKTDPAVAIELATHLTFDWRNRGAFREAREQLASALTQAPAGPTLSRASALLSSALFAWHEADTAGYQALAEDALDISRTLGDPVREGRALTMLGNAAVNRGDLNQAKRLLEDAISALDTPGGEPGRLTALSYHASVLAFLGDLPGAIAQQREIVATTRREGSQQWLARQLNQLGQYERLAGETETAKRSLDESIAIARQQGYKQVLNAALHSLGCVLQADEPAEALRAFTEGLQLGREIDDPNAFAYCFEGAAPILAVRGNPTHAATLLGAASAIRTRIGDTRTPSEKDDAAAAESQCRETLTPEAFATAWEQGAALGANAAADWALEVWEQAAQNLH